MKPRRGGLRSTSRGEVTPIYRESHEAEYGVALSGLILGLAFLTFSTASEEEANIFGFVVRSRILRGLGVITMLFSAITFVAACYGMGACSSREKPRRE